MGRVVEIERAAPPGSDDKRHSVVVDKGRINAVADTAAVALFGEGSPYYQRGDALVRLVDGHDAVRFRPGHESPLLVQATPAILLDDLERTCRFISRRDNDDGEVRLKVQACPKQLPAVMLGRAGRLPVPTIRGIAEVPLLRGDGTLCMGGFDAHSGILVHVRGDWPRLPESPTEADARAALTRFDELLSGFPFAGDMDRAITIAAFLSAVLRSSLPSCPAFAWSAPVRGSGKSKLADVASVLATGMPAPALSWPRLEEEAEKRIGAMVLAGDRVIAIDNVESALRGACLNSLLTQNTIAVRVLGRSQVLRMSAATLVMATGNNLMLIGDLSRRFLVAQLDPGVERPELRRFDFDPVERAQCVRRDLVMALLTIARWGQGVHSDAVPLGSFEVWSRRVRDPLVALGLPDPCKVLDKLHDADPEREAALEIVTEWERCFGGEQATVADAIRRATRHKDPDTELRDALDAVAGQPGGINSRRLGRYLKRIRDRVIAGKVMRQGHDLIGNVCNWRVEST